MEFVPSDVGIEGRYLSAGPVSVGWQSDAGPRETNQDAVRCRLRDEARALFRSHAAEARARDEWAATLVPRRSPPCDPGGTAANLRPSRDVLRVQDISPSSDKAHASASSEHDA